MGLIVLNYIIDPALDQAYELVVGIFFHDLICLVICKNGIEITVFQHGFDIGQILSDNARDLVITFEIHDLIFTVTFFPVSDKIFADIKIIRQTPQRLICACYDPTERIVASSVTESSCELYEIIVF